MPMSPRLLRPLASSVHPEAANWAARVVTNGGTVSGGTLAAVSKFCADIDAADIRNRFYRLNLFCGDSLSAALVPLYMAESATAAVRGGTTDTNNNFVSGDFNNTGSSSGLNGNGSTKYLSTGLAANIFTASNQHFGIGLRANNESGTGVFRDGFGVFNNTQAHIISVRRGAVGLLSATMGDYTANTNASMGDAIANTNLAAGNIVAAWPTMYRNGAASGTNATASANYPSAHNFFVFASNNAGTGPFGHANIRLNWYSVGLTMTASQASSFNAALNTFNTTLSRT